MRELAPSVDALVRGSRRTAWQPADTKSGARFEQVAVDGQDCVLKWQDRRDDWLMRATGDVGMRFVTLWTSGLLDEVPTEIDHAVLGCAVEDGRAAVLLRDVTRSLLAGDESLPFHVHRGFLGHMAQLHATFWGWRDTIGLTPLANRYRAFSPVVAEVEAALDSGALVPRLVGLGWAQLPRVAPRFAGVVMPLLDDPAPLLGAIERLPHTFVHGDWKAANLGRHPDGRTVLLDWGEMPGEAAPTADLAWYLALNAALLPEPKEAVVAAYRRELERAGVDTAGWFDRAMAVELLAAGVQFGWEKALGGPGPELDWWEQRAVEGARLL